MRNGVAFRGQHGELKTVIQQVIASGVTPQMRIFPGKDYDHVRIRVE